MLQAKPGCYIWLGGGRGPDTPNLHNPHYDFNDDALADRRELLGDARGGAAAAAGERARGGPHAVNLSCSAAMCRSHLSGAAAFFA